MAAENAYFYLVGGTTDDVDALSIVRQTCTEDVASRCAWYRGWPQR
jgi:hypothetical protein